MNAPFAWVKQVASHYGGASFDVEIMRVLSRFFTFVEPD